MIQALPFCCYASTGIPWVLFHPMECLQMFSYFSLLCFCILLQFCVVVVLMYVLLVCASLSARLGCEVCDVVRLFNVYFYLHLIKSKYMQKRKKKKMLGPVFVILIWNFLIKICHIIKIKCQVIVY